MAKNPFREKYPKQFDGFERIERIADTLLERNEAKAVWDSHRVATRAATSLYAKARKAARALYLLALNGYGEDGFILGRSMLNLAIDLEYICGKKGAAETIARQWFARGRIAGRELAAKAGTVLPREDSIDWKQELNLANAWKSRHIEQRAHAAGLAAYYDLPYRHGCSFDHSDSWSAASFLKIRADRVDLLAAPSDAFVDFALLAGAFALAQIVKSFGDFYAFDFAGADSELEEILRTHFEKEASPPASTQEKSK